MQVALEFEEENNICIYLILSENWSKSEEFALFYNGISVFLGVSKGIFFTLLTTFLLLMMGRRGEGDGMQGVKRSGKQNKWFKWFGDQIKGKDVHKIMRSDQQFFVTFINLALIFKWCVVYYQRRRRQKTIKSSKAKAKSGEIKKSKIRIEYRVCEQFVR